MNHLLHTLFYSIFSQPEKLTPTTYPALTAYPIASRRLWRLDWAYGYPVHLRVSTAQDRQAKNNIQAIDNAVKNIVGNFFVVAHSNACPVFLQWLFRQDIQMHRRLLGVILANPNKIAWSNDERLPENRIVMPCKTAIVNASGDNADLIAWTQTQAQKIHAKHLISPNTPNLNATIGGWQWGMRLMQDMLLA